MNTVSIKDFILSFVRRGNVKDAAIDAGIEPSRAGMDGLRLMSRPSVRKQIEKEREELYANGSDIPPFLHFCHPFYLLFFLPFYPLFFHIWLQYI